MLAWGLTGTLSTTPKPKNKPAPAPPGKAAPKNPHRPSTVSSPRPSSKAYTALRIDGATSFGSRQRWHRRAIPEPRRRGRSRPRRHQLLRRFRRPGRGRRLAVRKRPPDHRRRGQRRNQAHPGSLRAPDRRQANHRGQRLSRHRSQRRNPRRHHAQPHRHTSPSTPPCARSSASTSSRPARWSTAIACASTSRTSAA